ncbi:MAG: type II toxin-antitoxin system prevent-host-death family antitoxin [Verrucomicrobia bacterium]|nr:type II toxin-antitoxin system prevent-host-death family antitoxin [Verrucomicrobiota bacterium]
MTSVQANLHEAKTHLSRLVAKAMQGDDVVIAKAGKPLVRLVPLARGSRRKPGVLKGEYCVPETFFEPMSEEELEAWE